MLYDIQTTRYEIMKKKIRVGILFGGKSAEHEVSIQSARNIVEAINKEKYEIVLIGIDKKGQWHLKGTSELFLPSESSSLTRLNREDKNVALVPGEGERELVNLSNGKPTGVIDVVFPVLHGPYGEDGTVQGLLKLANIPCVGADILGSAVGMDKDVMKRLLGEAGIPTVKFLVFNQACRERIDFDIIQEKLGLPFFIKPANLGSSVGINKVKEKKEFQSALEEAFQYGNKILVEEYIKGREIECSVLGNDDPIASLPGEILPQDEFYSYEAKYIDERGAILEIPAKLGENLTAKIQNLSIKVFKVLCCQGMARVDFFLKDNDKIIVNELNTIPGFTKISMYPKLWEASGISYSELIDRLIQLALERFQKEKRLKTSI